MKRREVIALISALLMLCTNVLVYPLSKKDMVLKGALIEQPSSPEYKSRDDYFKELMEKTEKLRQEQEDQQKKAEEERKKRELENKPKINNEKTHKTNNNQETHIARDRSIEQKDFILTFYTNLPEENGGHTTTCQGKPARYGVVANNVIPLNTQIYLQGLGSFVVGDHGGNDFNSSNRLDVLIEKNKGETKEQYKKRVRSMGRVKVKGWIVR